MEYSLRALLNNFAKSYIHYKPQFVDLIDSYLDILAHAVLFADAMLSPWLLRYGLGFVFLLALLTVDEPRRSALATIRNGRGT